MRVSTKYVNKNKKKKLFSVFFLTRVVMCLVHVLFFTRSGRRRGFYLVLVVSVRSVGAVVLLVCIDWDPVGGEMRVLYPGRS